MKTFLNWIMLFCMVFGALGVSPMAQDIVVVAQAEEPPPVGESPEPLILPFVPDETAESALQLPVEDPAITEPPAPAPFLIQLDTSCDAWGQTARLSWSVTGELADTLGDKSELLVKLPAGLQPLEGMEIAPDGMLHLPASPEGQAVFSIQSEASETGWLDVRLMTADAEQAATRVEFIPGAYARLGIEGGRVDAKAMGVSVELPEKVLLADTAICIGPVTEAELPNSLSGQPFQLNAYNLEKGEEITRFDKNLIVRVKFNPETTSGKESQLKLFYYHEKLQDWAVLPTEVDEESNTLTGYTDHFTPFDVKAQSWESARLPTLDGFAVSEFTGAATYTYPIQLPAGAGGWQPSLALSYNSQVVDNANSMTQASWVGMGWSMDTGYIQRNMGENISYYGPQDPNGSDADIRLDNDTGHDGDDTFSLVLNGQSWRLLRLPDQDSNTETIEYRTENESFWRIRHNHLHTGGGSGYVTDSSTWEVWDKTGNKYTFSPEARYPIGCYSPFMLVWQWPLTTATNNFNQTISYTYAFDQEARRNGVGCDGAFTQVAVYPATISYSGYQVVFDRSARSDHKAAWDTYPDKEYQSIFYEQSRLAAIRILSQNGSNWELVRKYTLTHQDGVIFPSLIWDTNVTGSKTPTLTGITEYGSDGSSALPATTFTYTDGMHLVTGSNGYGGSVTYEFEKLTNRPWYEFQTTQDPIREYTNTQNQYLPFTTSIAGTLDVYDPGQMYKIELKVWPTTAVCTAGYYYTVSGVTTWVPGTLIEEETPSGATYKYMRWASFYSLLHPAPRFYFSCTGGGYQGQIKPFYAKVWPLVNRYRVTAKIVGENHSNTTSTASYTYTGTSTNNPAQSSPGDYPYTEPRTEFRGSSSVTEIGPQGLAGTTWYGQKDDYSGLPLAQMTALQQVYDDFDALDTGVWSYSHYGTRQVIAKEEGEPLLKMENPNADWSTVMVRNTPTLQDGESAVIQFKLSEENAQAVLALTTASPNPYERWGIYVHNDANGNPYAELQYKADGAAYQYHPLLEPGEFHADTWYVMVLTAGVEQFSARIWQRDDPAVFGQWSAPFSTGKNWQFLQYIYDGTLYLDDYREGPVYGLQLNSHDEGNDYTSPTIVPPYEYPGNNAYTDLGVSWIAPLQTTTFSLGESGRFTGTRQETQYDPARQGNAQYGNITNQIESYWVESTSPFWYPYRMTLTGYYPNVSLTDPVKNLVGLPGFSNQYKCENDSACTATNARLLGSTWYLYDSHTSYSQQPTAGIRTGQRSLLYWGDPATPSDPYYLDQDYTYDGYGNLATSVNYATPGSYSTRSTSNPRKSETIYDTQHHAFPVETRAYYNTSQYYATTYTYDYRLGVPTSITGPNGAATIIEAGYDVFGRITSIVRPGDSSGTPTMRFTYNQSSSLFWTQVEQLISGSTYYKARKFYNGLGQLVQSQEDAMLGTTLQTVVTDTEYNNLGLVAAQSMPYAVGLASGYTNPAGQFFTQTTYDELGRVNTITKPDNSLTVMNYKIHLLDSQPASVTYTEDANNHISEAWADAFGRLLKSQGATGPAVTYTYDAADHLTSALYGSAQTQISYDIAGRKLTLDDPDMGLWSYAYDALGNLTQQTDARGCLTTLAYDGLNRLTGKSYSNASGGSCAAIAASTPSVTYGYDAGTNGKLQRTSMSDGSGSTAWTYDSRGRIIEEIKSISGVGSFKTVTAYNSADLLDSIQYPDTNANAISAARYFLYHPQLSLKEFKYTSSLSYVKDIQYDAAGRITTRTLGNNLILTNSYHDWDEQGGRLDTTLAERGLLPVQSLEYTYDDVGNITQIRDHVAEIYPIEWQDQDFSYDDLNRLVSASATGSPADGGYSESYTYDAATGNLGSKAGVSYGYNDAAHDHAVTHLGGVQKYWYDANGNQVTRIVGSDTYNLSHDAENRLVEVKKNNTTIAAFDYDGDGQRVIATNGTTTTGYIGDHTEWQVGAANQPTRYYNAGGMRLATRVNGVMYYPLTDHLGSTTVTTDANGYEVAEIRYKTWGETRYTWNTTPTKHTYTGQYSNVADFGLMYYNARWYDPGLSRWVQPDTILPESQGIQAFDRYSYVNNSPVNYTDPSGHWLETLWDIGSVVLDIVDIVNNGLSWQNGAALAIDVVSVALPAVPAVGSFIFKASRAAKTIENISDAAKVIDSASKLSHADEIVEATGQLHHVFSKKIMDALNKHDTLGGLFNRNDFIVQALDKASHNGYQSWHREYDDEIVEWLTTFDKATQEDFLSYLLDLYNRVDMQEKFPDAYKLIEMGLEELK